MDRPPGWSRDATVALAAPAHGLIRRLRLRLTRVEHLAHGHVIWDDALSQRWHTAYRKAWRIAPTPPASRCPTCGVKGHLRVEFTGGHDLIGHATMWCGRCRTGIVTCRTSIPAQATMRDRTTGEPSPTFVLVYARNDLPPSLRWARATTAALGLLLACTAATGALLWLLDHPASGFVLQSLLAWVFRGFGVSCAAAVFLRLRLRWSRPEYTFPSTAAGSKPDQEPMSPPSPGSR
jgi:hypothetical protein